MKKLYRIFFLFSLFIALSNYALAHSVQVAYCVSDNGGLRIFFEHWHGVENPNSTTMTISLTVNGNTTTQTASPAGSIMNTPMDSLPDCYTQIISAAGCSDTNTYNDWVWFDYTGLPCDTPITFTIVSGNTVFTQDGCGMYPLSVNFTIPCGSGIVKNNTKTKFIISPNPFSTQTTLHTDRTDGRQAIFHNATLTVDNYLGQTVKQLKNISGHTVTLHRDNLPSGLYFVRLIEENKTIAADRLIITDK